MKKSYVFGMVLMLLGGLLLTGCFNDEDSEDVDTNDEVNYEENGTTETSREQVIEDSGLEIGAGSGSRHDPYIIDIDEMHSGNITDYVEGVPRLHFKVPARAHKTYTATLVVTSTSLDPDARYTFTAGVTGTEGMYTDSDAKQLEGLDLVGQDMTVSVTASEMAREVNFNISTNASDEDVYYEFYVIEE